MVLNSIPSPNFIICGKKIFSPHEKHVTRKFSRCVLILMFEGELQFLEDGKLITLTPGEYYIQRNDLRQQGVPLTGELPIYFFFEFFGTFSESQVGLPLRGEFDPQRIVPLTERCDNIFHGRNADFFKLNSYLLRIFSELLENAPTKRGNDTLTEQVHSLIESQYASPITLEEIAKRFGYTQEYILRIFKAHYGMSPHQYLIQLRMDHAMWLLENTDISVEQTAISVGYTDYSAFYRSFKKTFGTTPISVKKSKPRR